MTAEYVETDVLVTVMTYPHPSQKHQELVCTAGILRDGNWVRLYPIDYRYMPVGQKFHKFQWVRLGLAPKGAGNDNRKESRRPDLSTLRLLGEPLRQAESQSLIEQLPHRTMLELRTLYDTDATSLGIVRPVEILDMLIEPAETTWKPEWQAVLSQIDIFSGTPKDLRKIPFKFSFRFRCEDTGDSYHTAMVEDWELGALFLREAERLGSDQAAADSVRRHYIKTVCGPSRDVRFFMGTTFPWNSWVIVGVYWPPKIYQPKLF